MTEWRYSFITLDLSNTWRRMVGLAAFTPRKQLPVATVYEATWVSEPFWIL
jgi:hypothetical protein